ncbi:MAG: 3-coathanger stack domain-containing protein, partial [Saprospiraceae bacterium]
NSKYQDGDGNGLINEADLDVLSANYGLRHATKLSTASFTEGVEYQIEPKGYQGDGKIKYDIHVTLDDAPISVHGVAFTVDFNDLPIADAYVEVTNSSINPDECLYFFNATTNTLEVGITRSDKQNQNTNGSVGSLIVITENIGIGDPMDLDIRVGRRMKADGDFKAIASTSIQDTYVELGASSSHFLPIVYATHEECDRFGSAKIALLGGTAPYTIQWSNGQTTPEIKGLTAGQYTVTATDANNLSKSYTVNIKKQYIPIYDENGGIINCVLPTTCESFLDLSDNIATNSYQAATTITADGIIATGSTVVFKAGESITLESGFSVTAGADFTASIEACIPNNSVISTEPPVELKTIIPNTIQAISSIPFNLQILPNPINNSATIVYDLPINGGARLILSDMQGKPIKVLFDKAYQNRGSYEVVFTAADLAKGVYFVSLVTSKNVVTKKIIILK